jgi:hypothetical protein
MRDTWAVVGEAPPVLGAVEYEASVKCKAGGAGREIAAAVLGDPSWPDGSSGPRQGRGHRAGHGRGERPCRSRRGEEGGPGRSRPGDEVRRGPASWPMKPCTERRRAGAASVLRAG